MARVKTQRYVIAFPVYMTKMLGYPATLTVRAANEEEAIAKAEKIAAEAAKAQ